MAMRFIPRLLIVLACGAVAMGQATVYKSVDEHGVVTFSDTPPADADSAERVEIHAPPPSSTGEYEANLEAMRETTDRMAADRREREKHRAELRESQARAAAYRNPPEPEPYRYDNYISGYDRGWGYYQPGKPPWRPGHRPRPEHPIARPPHRLPPDDGLSRPTDNNSQLMRPITGRR